MSGPHQSITPTINISGPPRPQISPTRISILQPLNWPIKTRLQHPTRPRKPGLVAKNSSPPKHRHRGCSFSLQFVNLSRWWSSVDMSISPPLHVLSHRGCC